MKMKLQRDEPGHMRTCSSVSQMRPNTLPQTPSTRWAGVSLLKAEDGGAQRGGCRGRPEGAGEELVHRHTGVPPPGRELPRLVPRLCCKKVSNFTLVSIKRYNFTALT